MASEKRHAGETAKVGGACALAGCVRIVAAANVAMSAGAFALVANWGLPVHAVGFALVFAVSAFMLKGGAA